MLVFAWVGLVVSWLLLVLVMKSVFLTLRLLKQTRELAEMTRDAAVHLADNLADDEAFAELELLAAQLPEAVRGLPPGAAAARPNLSSLSPGVGGPFP
jgi:biopolymer transport protein ExbB/TolQ